MTSLGWAWAQGERCNMGESLPWRKGWSIEVGALIKSLCVAQDLVRRLYVSAVGWLGLCKDDTIPVQRKSELPTRCWMTVRSLSMSEMVVAVSISRHQAIRPNRS